MAGLSNAHRSAATRRALLDAAHELFATQGYAATTPLAIAQRAKRTQGALQYHFTDKATLFRAVYTEQSSAFVAFIVARIQAAKGDTLWERVVVTMCHAFVERAADPSARRVLYLDGPAILGWGTIQQIGPGLALIRQTFELLMADRVIAPRPARPPGPSAVGLCSSRQGVTSPTPAIRSRRRRKPARCCSDSSTGSSPASRTFSRDLESWLWVRNRGEYSPG